MSIQYNTAGCTQIQEALYQHLDDLIQLIQDESIELFSFCLQSQQELKVAKKLPSVSIMLFTTGHPANSSKGCGLYVYNDIKMPAVVPPIVSSSTMAELNLLSILSSRKLTLDALRHKCPENHLAIVARSIMSWKQLSPFLGLTQQDEDDIQHDNTRNAERKIAMLRRWKEKYGDEATYFRLADAFEALKWRNCISELLDLFQQEVGISASPISTFRAVSNGQPVSPLGNFDHKLWIKLFD